MANAPALRVRLPLGSTILLPTFAALAGTLSRLRRTHAPGKMMTREYSLDPLVLGKRPLFAWESRKLEVTTRETTTKGLPW